MIPPPDSGGLQIDREFSEAKKLSKKTVATAVALFEVKNSDWILRETGPGVFELVSRDDQWKITDIDGNSLASAGAVIAELDRHLRSRG